MSDADLYQALSAAQAAGQPCALATVIKAQGSVPRHPGAKMLVRAEGDPLGTVGGGEMESRVITRAHELMAQAGPPETLRFELTDPARGDPGVCGGQVEIFLEPLLPEPTVLIIGCGHCGQALAELADWLGWRVIATDDRADLCSPAHIPQAKAHIVCPPAEIAQRVNIHRRTYIAAVTRGVPIDLEMLPALLRTPAAYIGVMGSRRRWAVAAQKLREQGLSEADLARINAPLGLELAAETPREIALSIMAEIIALQRGGDGKPMTSSGKVEGIPGSAGHNASTS